MKFSAIFGLVAAVSAAPAHVNSARAFSNSSQLSDLNFSNINFQYLNIANSLDLQLLATLGNVNRLNLVNFQSLFQGSSFSLQSLLDFQQLAMVLQLAQAGLFSGFNLSSLSFEPLNLGLISGIGNFDIGSLVDQALLPQITQVVETGVPIAK